MLNATIFALMAVCLCRMNDFFAPYCIGRSITRQFFDIKKAVVDIDKDIITDIVYKTRGFIPEDGSGGALGYGVLTAVP
jgi:hypothetical protein